MICAFALFVEITCYLSSFPSSSVTLKLSAFHSAGISTLIANGAGKEELENVAKQNGTRLLRDNVSELVQQGVTTIDELIRVTYAV